METQSETVLRADLRRLAERTADLKAEAEPILAEATPAQWTWSPAPSTWSMALVVEHLNSVARLGLTAIEGGVARLRSEGVLSDVPPRYGFGERFFIRLLSPNPPFQVPVPAVYVPLSPGDPAVNTGPEFLRALDRAVACIVSANGLNLTKLKLPSPADARIRLTVGAWLEGLVAHNDYHWLQVKALRSHPGFPHAGQTPAGA